MRTNTPGIAASAGKAAASVLLVFLGLSGLAARAQEATNVGEAKCLTCHKVEDEHFSGTPHARVFRGNPKTVQERLVCEACHGPGSKHVETTGDKMRISADRGRCFSRIVDGISEERGRRFRLIVDAVSA